MQPIDVIVHNTNITIEKIAKPCDKDVDIALIEIIKIISIANEIIAKGIFHPPFSLCCLIYQIFISMKTNKKTQHPMYWIFLFTWLVYSVLIQWNTSLLPRNNTNNQFLSGIILYCLYHLLKHY